MYNDRYITIDTSAIIAVIGNEQSKQRIVESTKDLSLCAPMSIQWEIGNAFPAMFKKKKFSMEAAKQALAAYHYRPYLFLAQLHKCVKF
uniref:PIN domain-containing protein n=1 Tax=Candidatus Kentrum sp. LPFa TaxID=2126335 RepID=A0A450WY74_9GAMM|nr:MAG: hypothetical protein BECKLPF1236A_GA0070988_103284 [Candidatus Kentron sp. LPFa]VFK35004.1 MAG: hypothetical protein BECKLPF1236C_GA0070990_103214 [Candidatus Kentron sp. LPFa]